MDIYDTEAFAMLQVGMKDSEAYEVVAALIAVQSGTDKNVFTHFEEFATEQNKYNLENGGHV